MRAVAVGDPNGDGAPDLISGGKLVINKADDRANLTGAVGFQVTTPPAVN